jgi:hypothetical protein
MTRATYSVLTTKPGFICVIDKREEGVMSVTNDAENVIADLLKDGYDLVKNRVLYRDSDRIWDEIVVRAGKFDGFRHLGAKDLDVAIDAARAGGRA